MVGSGHRPQHRTCALPRSRVPRRHSGGRVGEEEGEGGEEEDEGGEDGGSERLRQGR
jgi:hypothetical protein